MARDSDNMAPIPANAGLAMSMRNAVKRLIGKARELKSSVSQLQMENEGLKEELRKRDEEVSVLRQQLESCKLGIALRDSASDSSGYTRDEAKRRISRMVREIDECIALLKQ